MENKNDNSFNKSFIEELKRDCIHYLKQEKRIIAEVYFNIITNYYEKIASQKAFNDMYSFFKQYRNELEKIEEKELLKKFKKI